MIRYPVPLRVVAAQAIIVFISEGSKRTGNLTAEGPDTYFLNNTVPGPSGFSKTKNQGLPYKTPVTSGSGASVHAGNTSR